jgi:hypothetical protein
VIVSSATFRLMTALGTSCPIMLTVKSASKEKKKMMKKKMKTTRFYDSEIK